MKKYISKSWQLFKKTPLGGVIRKASPQWLVNNLEHLPVSIAANVFYNFPSKKIKVIGVTGTDGKTTTTNMIYQILSDAGIKVSMVSTINAVIAGKSYATGFHVTSPHSFDIQEYVKKAVKNQDEYIVLEVTSHSLDQYRFWGIKFDMAVITNITHEHLDYHKTWENYFNTKAKLIANSKIAIINKDESHFDRLKKLSAGKVISFGFNKDSDFNPKNFSLNLKIPGDFNILNGLAAAAVAENCGVSKNSIQKSLTAFTLPKGRLEKIDNKKGINIYVDFAHTPNGLESAIVALKKAHPKGRMITITGAEGYRDQAKRPLMGEIGASLSDYLVITAVDPRGLIDKINQDILTGVTKAGGVIGKDVFLENDRAKAIDYAIRNLAKKGDIVGIFGKGHELTMNIDGITEGSWSDYEAIEQALKK